MVGTHEARPGVKVGVRQELLLQLGCLLTGSQRWSPNGKLAKPHDLGCLSEVLLHRRDWLNGHMIELNLQSLPPS